MPWQVTHASAAGFAELRGTLIRPPFDLICAMVVGTEWQPTHVAVNGVVTRSVAFGSDLRAASTTLTLYVATFVGSVDCIATLVVVSTVVTSAPAGTVV